MICDMAKAKIAVTLPVALVKRVQAAVREGRASSVSAYISAALRQRESLGDLKVMLEELLIAAGGPLKNRKRVAANATLATAARKKPKRRRK
jgi:Arc/MetJ-type ribon-helix-helix transcriptional regulator